MEIALIGGGPSALFMYKRLIESELGDIAVTIFEKSGRLGAGMPYSSCGSDDGHITNVSSNEIPELPMTPQQWLDKENIVGNLNGSDFGAFKVFPRRLFGDYLEGQFSTLIDAGRINGIATMVLLHTEVEDMRYDESGVTVLDSSGKKRRFDKAVICTGHRFPGASQETSTGFFPSPYPPRKLSCTFNHPVALRGASLTAVDAIKTLARANGSFIRKRNGTVTYKLNPQSVGFKMVMHCRSGMLPAVRFHLNDPRLRNPSMLTQEQIEQHRNTNEGFVSLDYIYEKDFKEPLQKADPAFYEKIRELTMEGFVAAMLERREHVDPFVLMKSECNEARKSIDRRQSVCWKEMLGALSFALNYPAKYFSAEDMIRYKSTLHPLISLVIAYVPQSSCRELLALHKAGCLEMINVGKDSTVQRRNEGGINYRYTGRDGSKVFVAYQTYIDCTGQPQIDFCDFPFRGLSNAGVVTQASMAFRDGSAAAQYLSEHPDDVVQCREGYMLKVPGIAVTDNFQVVGRDGLPNQDIFTMAVALMGGYNPDYSGLDFSEEASARIAGVLCRQARQPVSLQQDNEIHAVPRPTVSVA